MALIRWQAREFNYKKKSINWYWIVFTIILLLSFSTFYFFQDPIFAILIIFIGFLILFAASKKPQTKRYEINPNGFSIEDDAVNILFKDIENYNIDEKNFKILIKIKSKFQPLISIPFEKNHNIYKIDKYLTEKIKKDKKLAISIPELLLLKLMGI
ncbi:MAG: hypothetical protein KAI16_01275 [Candidatus Pacebacteria bacterium]|nr:hypothetical protein [Candidatus Paceibacterota bacterium]